ncbi:MAG: pyridoxal phosphate-dependent aminotransferase [Synergistaceae bacterium]|nr:pyridoxal phosphate-dependent aminotransferase [Synergistota bacterium]NLM71267.1 pyridoxal phosphate-dependent aminotransferase [Synergistaceae bacterium]
MHQPKVAQRFKDVQPSPMTKIFQAAESIDDLSNLSIGEPDFHTEAEIVDAAASAAKRGVTHYPPLAGYPELKREICAYWKRHHSVDFSPEEVLVTVGGIQATHLCFKAMLDPGDEVMLTDPCFSAYLQQVRLNEGTVVQVPAREENGFFPEAADFDRAVTPRTKILLINSPCNPTGGVLTEEQAESIADVARKHDLLLITDEIYENFLYSGKHIPMASLPGMRERTATIGGLSKSHCMTGWRIGYVIAPPDLLKVMLQISVNEAYGVNVLSQMGAIEALRTQDAKMRIRAAEYEKRVRYGAERLNAMPGVTCPEPRGAFYLFPDISGTGMDDMDFAWWLLEEAKVATIPGSAFGKCGAGHVRIACTLSMDDLEKAFDRMDNALKNRG